MRLNSLTSLYLPRCYYPSLQVIFPRFSGRLLCSWYTVCSDLLSIQYNFVHSFQPVLWQGHSLFPKRVFNRVRPNASSLNFQYPFFSFKLSSSCLPILPRLPVTFFLSLCIPLIMCSGRQFLRKMWPIQLASLPFTVYRMFLFPLTLCPVILYFSHNLFNWFSPSLCSTTFQNFPNISDLLETVHSALCPYQIHDTKATKCTNLLLICLYYNITFDIPTCFALQRTIFRETNQSNTT